MSIQTYLEKNGYRAHYNNECFVKLINGEWVAIPFSALAGHTIESFQALAEKEGWIKKTEDPAILRTVTMLPYKATMSVRTEPMRSGKNAKISFADSPDGPWIYVAKKENWIRKYSETEPNDK